MIRFDLIGRKNNLPKQFFPKIFDKERNQVVEAIGKSAFLFVVNVFRVTCFASFPMKKKNQARLERVTPQMTRVELLRYQGTLTRVESFEQK